MKRIKAGWENDSFPPGKWKFRAFLSSSKACEIPCKVKTGSWVFRAAGVGEGSGFQRSNFLRVSGVDVKADLEGSPRGISSLTYVELQSEHHLTVFNEISPFSWGQGVVRSQALWSAHLIATGGLYAANPCSLCWHCEKSSSFLTCFKD